MPNLFDIQDKAQCCGCSACFAACPTNAITLTLDSEGFLYPKISKEKCVDCNRCVQVCPLKKDRDNVAETKDFFAIKHRKKDTIQKSSSGGFFTAISDFIFEKGGVVYGVSFDENFRAIHTRADNQSARNKMCCSKYLQSDLGETFQMVKADLTKGIPVLFTGTPCQVEGIHSYLGRDYKNFYAVDIICHGVPSPLMFSEHITNIEKKRKTKVVNYKCRSKIKGWHTHTEEAFFKNGKSEAGTPLLQEHKVLFYKGYILRPSCYECRFTNLKRSSDITMGDFWGIEKSMPDWDDQIGTSMILLNTPKGKQLFEAVHSDIECRASETYGRQPQLERSAEKPSDREAFWTAYLNKGYRYIAAKYGRNNLKENLKFSVKKALKKYGLR
ncbi:MAG: Coenzyme F420 hydrogenase/dehydrogenase, beta subunit C-terminal domain [Lachnospiraceae bacterium]|nr:Coenzyme F420 hydrogenase/dehydrogenase, beta subunit C-terminal domain [Lachnospiraceae bacterium]MBQ8797044.1 Coenzyme F420 hydrogenase/dehydrogenase, beta subunit C-terminal domain [Oscillospiraceae bacterium]